MPNGGNNQQPKTPTLNLDDVACPLPELFAKLKTTENGLSDKAARQKLLEDGPNEAVVEKKHGVLFQFFSKFLHPLVILLLVIGTFSFIFDEKISASIVLLLAVISVFLTFIQEYRSGKEAEKLKRMVRTTATVYRNNKQREIQIRDIVRGDVIYLSAGDMVPADLRIISCKDLFINHSALTGESFQVEKTATPPADPKKLSLSELNNMVFMGSSVVSGTANAVVVSAGASTQFGEVSRRVSATAVQTSFDKGVRKFTWVMIRIMSVLVVFIFGANMFLKGNFKDSLLFALCVAVGLTPEMLPMLVALCLSKGAIAMSRKSVIVKRLNSIQNFGAMDVLCTDKTGTLTEDKIILEKHCDVVREQSDNVLTYAYLNSYYQTGLKNILDRAILKYAKLALEQYKKVDEIPFDFARRIMSVVVEKDGQHILIAKGAPEEIIKRCTHYELDKEVFEKEELVLADLIKECDSLSADGFRVLAIAYKNFKEKKEAYSRNDESEMVLFGYVAFLDPPKLSTKKAILGLQKLGVQVKVLTGDNDLVTRKICGEVGLDVQGLLTGQQIEGMTDQELQEKVKTTTVFARLSPFQKEKVIHALHANNHIVGFLGDGINDAPALKTADVGISVNNAVDIAKESADFILLKKSLMVLQDGVIEGRRTFGNIVKYVRMGASSNFGNMFSMTGSTMVLPFLPMLPIQILLNNFLYDLSQAPIPTDHVDDVYVTKPRPWNIKSIRNFMFWFGPLSSIFDYVTFGFLMLIVHAPQDLFHTTWFLESLCTQTMVIFVIRTTETPFVKSWPSLPLLISSLAIVSFGFWLPFSPFANVFGFVQPPLFYIGAILLITLIYLVLAEILKRIFAKKYGVN